MVIIRRIYVPNCVERDYNLLFVEVQSLSKCVLDGGVLYLLVSMSAPAEYV